jgi:hypothetical protein
MNKSIELPQLTIKALQDGATSFVVPIDQDKLNNHIYNEARLEGYIKLFALLQAGDKDVFVKEELPIYPPTYGDNSYLTGYEPKTTLASQMTKEQSRFNIDIEDVRVVRVQDIDFDTKQDIFPYQRIMQCYDEEQFANVEFAYKVINLMQEHEHKHYAETGKRISLGNYEDNPYVFLYDVKVTTKEFYKETEDK